MKTTESRFSIYTDLAIEARELISETVDEDLPGVMIKSYQNAAGSITVTWVEIVNEQGQSEMGKPIGNYVTIEAPKIKENCVEVLEEAVGILATSLLELIELREDSSVLVVGLGNWNVTPDALGPKVVSKTFVTRQIIDEVPFEIDEKVRPVAALSPGVMGITGIETLEIIKGVVDRTKPDLVIAIDALAARRTSRINSTIQMTDTGVSPGGGVGNKRKTLSKETLGVPVIAIGIPTVVDAATLINDTMDKMLEGMINETQKGGQFYQMLKDLAEEERYGLIVEVLEPYSENMFVTPKEVDAVIEKLAKVVANGINRALHPKVDWDGLSYML